MTFSGRLIHNEVLISSVVGWTVAQVLKTLIDMWLNKGFKPERLVGSGGMPSSHSATVCGLLTSAGLCYGVDSFEFAVSFVLASVVMYDAVGVRRETGKQAKLLNMIMKQDFFRMNGEEVQESLKELVGHTPLQVVVGAALGVGMAFFVHGFYL
ncbi:MAG: divergent PAP2 family protein [Clostridiales bacterium]|nr:divergent PAP2 family protein [Clostridiales bacterium]